MCESELKLNITHLSIPDISWGRSFNSFIFPFSFSFNPTQGFACRKQDQANNICQDYKVRFGTKCTKKQADLLIITEGD